jgi:hypothetical protein
MKLPLKASRDPSSRTDISSIPSFVYLQQPLIRPVIQPDRFFWMGLFCDSSNVFLGGFVFVTATVEAHTQHTEHFF